MALSLFDMATVGGLTCLDWGGRAVESQPTAERRERQERALDPMGRQRPNMNLNSCA